MRNHKPIFVNGFSRGGTTILTNLIASHPGVCLIGETHHAFKGHSITDSMWCVLRKCLYRDAPVLAGQRQDFFSPRLIAPRKPLTPRSRTRIDRILYHEKLRSRHPLFNLYKSSDTEYLDDEIRDSRLLCKNVDGMIFAAAEFAKMYPDASFYGLVRNGFAVCEGHIRRGRPAEEIGWRYQVLVDRMYDDASQLPNYQIVRFEDLVAEPLSMLHRLCTHAGLEFAQISQVRMQVRRVMDAQGNHRLVGGSEWDVVWFDPADLVTYFQRDVDDNQAKRLNPQDRDAFLRQAGAAMERLGYATSADDRLVFRINDFREASAAAAATAHRKAA
jgi:hypothetical protein